MNKDFFESMESTLVEIEKEIIEGKQKKSDIEMYNPLVLAYVGDSVYETFVRTLLVSKGSMQVNKLHKGAIKYVKAKSQAGILQKLEEDLTEDEKIIVKRGRNTKSATVPKNAELSDYRYATGFECLIGYLFLTGRVERLMELLNRVIDVTKEP